VSWRAAPLYTRAHDLARDLLPRVEAGGYPALRHRLATEAQELLCEVSLALTFPDGRAAHQAAADRSVTRLKVLVRLARELDVLTERGARHVGEQLVEIGRILGGWRRRPDRRGHRGEEAPSPAQGV